VSPGEAWRAYNRAYMAVTINPLAVSATALTDDPRRAPQLARRLGFAGLAYPAASASVDLTQLSATGRREFRQLFSSQDQQLVALAADLGPRGFAPGADVDRVLSRLDKVLEAARGLAVPLVTADLGPLPPVADAPKPKPRVTTHMAGLILLPDTAAATSSDASQQPSASPPVDPAFVSQVDAALLDLGQRADRYNVMLAFRSDLSSFASLDRALRRADCPWFGVDLDPVAILRDEWDADEVFSTLGPLIRHVRARDAVAGTDHRTRPAIIGQGTTDWPALLARLDEAGYHGWITIDPTELPDRTAAAQAGRKYIAAIGPGAL
jgi:sugar phosphate isomerase/epimerase